MLANNHNCKLQSQYFKTMQRQHIERIIPSDDISVLLPLGNMFSNNPDLAYAFASEAYFLFTAQGRCTADDFQPSYNLLAHYGVALSNLFFGYDFVSGDMSLYTSSLTILKSLASKGFLKGKKNPIAMELNDIEKKLYESDRIRKSIKDGNKLISVRLDYEVIGGTVIFKPTIPRSPIDLNNFIIVPFLSVNEAMSTLTRVLSKYVLKIVQGDKIRYVTKNEDVLASIYGAERAKYLVSHIPDPRTMRFYVPSIGASIYSAGLTNIRLDAVDSISYVSSLAEIDLSEITLDFSQAKDYFAFVVNSMDSNGVAIVASDIVIPSYNVTVAEAKREIIEVSERMYNREVYDFMKSHSDLFNIEEYKKLPSKYGNKYEVLQTPTSVEVLRGMLEHGIYKVLLTSRKGSLSTVICTNDHKSLSKFYGKRYTKYYESEGNRLREMRYYILINKPNLIAPDDLKSTCSMFNLDYIYDMGIKMTGSTDVDRGMCVKAYILQCIDSCLNDIKDVTTVVRQPHLVTVRSLEARIDEEGNPVGYYKYIDLKSIVSIIKLAD